ncbi:MAG: helix-turn-helix transcriptional regulator [Actinomycetia bacterium]|nr:helix-turn-helix transcriptional regulator [Actinomycetales bacterium]MCP4852530.1 helix-turn-helix transcriptional regulator [Actinomycetes bacterium]
MSTTTTLGTALRILRECKGWTQEQAAEKMEISTRTLINYEQDKRTPAVCILQDIADTFGVSVGALASFQVKR